MPDDHRPVTWKKKWRLFECGNKRADIEQRILTQKPRQNIREQGADQLGSGRAGPPSFERGFMKLYKIIDTVIPYVEHPCKIAIFTDGRRMKIYERYFPAVRLGRLPGFGISAWRNGSARRRRWRYISEIENETAKAVKQYIAEKDAADKGGTMIYTNQALRAYGCAECTFLTCQGFERYCGGFPEKRKPKRFWKTDPQWKAPKWCPRRSPGRLPCVSL